MKYGLKTSGKSIKTIIILACVALVLFIPAGSAIPSLPCEYSGQVAVDGAPAPAGTNITAFVNGTVRGMVVMGTAGALGGPGTFDARLVVTATEEDTAVVASPDVAFYVNGIRADTVDPFSAGASRTVTLATKSLKALPANSVKPTDPDGDFVYEDLNGNGRKDFNDVVLFFKKMDWIAANEPVSAFDLNQNNRIDFNDIVRLFREV